MQDVSFNGSYLRSGHEVTLDGPKELGGKDLGMRPMEMMLDRHGRMYFIRCSYNFKKIKTANVTGMYCRNRCDTRADEVPKVFTSIHIRFLNQRQ